MLRFIGILVAMMYMTVTSGVVINIHYCMGEVATVDLGHNSEDSCGQCGMDNSGCCHDEVQVVKLCADQLSAKVNHELPQTVLSQHDAMDTRNEIPAKWVGTTKVHTTPKSFDRNIHYKVFRI
ncbi:MAG: hypothetical protein WBP58_07235 [Chitinophagaceae bacterium]